MLTFVAFGIAALPCNHPLTFSSFDCCKMALNDRLTFKYPSIKIPGNLDQLQLKQRKRFE